MASVFLGSTIRNLRLRKEWEQEEFKRKLYKYEPSVYRLEYGELLPSPDHLQNIMDVLDAPMDEMLCPHLDSQPMEVYTLRYMLQQALDSLDLREAQKLFGEITAKMCHDGPVNRQFVLSQKARLMELRGDEPADILPLVLEGIKETYKEFDEHSPSEDVLLFEEAELFHTLAKIYGRMGRIRDGIRILRQTHNGLKKHSVGERERDRRAVPILLSLAAFLMQAGEYEEALKVCDDGIKESATRSLGKGMPDFLQHKAEATIMLGQGAKVDHLLRMAYAGYLLLGEKEKAEGMLEKVGGMYGITVDTLGMEKVDMPQGEKVPYARGLPPKCDSIGEMILLLRTEAKLSLDKLSQGICSKANLWRIEKGAIRGHMFYFEPILQRLGRDPSLYCNFFLLREDFEAVSIRDMIHLMLIHRKYEKAAELLEKLKKFDKFKKKANLQFVLDVENTLRENFSRSLEPSLTEEKILEALRITCPKFNEKDIQHYPLTHRESILINKLAVHYKQSKDYERAAKIYEALIANLDRRYVDEYEKARMYATVMYNYSTCLGLAGKRKEALGVVEKAFDFEQKRGRLSLLPNLLFNKAYTLFMDGEKEVSLPYFVLSYYGTCLFEEYGQANNVVVSRKFISGNFEWNTTL